MVMGDGVPTDVEWMDCCCDHGSAGSFGPRGGG